VGFIIVALGNWGREINGRDISYTLAS